jgi:two-component system, LuxR family, sensor kinase FixL
MPSINDDRLSALLNAAVDPIVLIDPRGQISRFNPAAERLFGYSSEEVLGRNVNILMPEPYRAEHDHYIERYLHTHEPRIIGIGREVTARRKDGSTFPIELAVGEFSGGGEHGFVGILRDISQRREYESQLRRQSEELQLIFDNAPTAIVTATLDGAVLAANLACSELLDRHPESLRGRSIADLVHADDRAELQQLLAGVHQAYDESFRSTLRLVRADGATIHALLYVAVAHDGEGAPLMMVAEIVDRTAQMEASREAEELRTRLAHVGRLGTLGEMVSGIAHEVNQPLTAIANYARACRRLLLAGQAQPEELAVTLDKIAAQAERAGAVISGLRGFVRNRELTCERLDCNELIREVLRLVEFDLRLSGVRTELALSSALPDVVADRVQVQQVILNLIRNALDAMADSECGDLLQIVTGTEGDWIEMRVIDEGPGIPEPMQDRLFEPFFTTKSEGIGLGLSICKSIIAAHGGELVYAPADTGGACFTIRLPCHD